MPDAPSLVRRAFINSRRDLPFSTCSASAVKVHVSGRHAPLPAALNKRNHRSGGLSGLLGLGGGEGVFADRSCSAGYVSAANQRISVFNSTAEVP